MTGCDGMRLAPFRIMARIAALFLAICMAGHASAQSCPSSSAALPDTPSAARALTGKLLYHDGIRQWFELRADRPVCGKPSIQITADDDTAIRLERLRGCRVHTTGAIEFSPTGYYSLDLFQHADKVVPVEPCANKAVAPDYASARPDGGVRAYTVRMLVDYRPGDHPVAFSIAAGRHALRPWQAYASYFLTGGFSLLASCGSGFVVDRVFGTPAARPSHFDLARSVDDRAVFEPEWAAAARAFDLHLNYTCVRVR